MSDSFEKKFVDDDDDDDDDDEDDDDDDDSAEQEPPYRSLTSPSGMKRYGTLASLEMLDEKEQEASDSEGNEEWDSDPEEDCNKNKPVKDQEESRK